MHLCRLSTICVWLVLVLCGVVCGEESEPVPSEHPDAAKIRQLIADLSADDYSLREKVHQSLLLLGEPVWPFLRGHMEDDDWERRSRIRMLGAFIGMPSELENEQIRGWLSQLENRDDEMVRAQGLDGLLEYGPLGLRILREHLSGVKAQPTLEIDLPETVWTSGKEVYCEALIRNLGPGVYWRRSYLSSQVNFSMVKKAGFGVERDDAPFGFRSGGGRRRLVSRGGYRNPIRDWVPVAAGGLIQEGGRLFCGGKPGVYELKAHFRCEVPTVIRPRIPGTTETVCLSVQHAGCPSVEQTATVFVLPDFQSLPIDERLSLRVRRSAEQGNDLPGEQLAVDVELRAGDAPIALEVGFAKYAWFVWLDHIGTPVKWGSWASAMGLYDEGPKGVELNRNGVLTCRLNLDCPKASGRYSLLTYYEVAPAREPAPDSDTVEGPKGVALFENGKLCARMDGISVDSDQE